jgi:hypothetical protein
MIALKEAVHRWSVDSERAYGLLDTFDPPPDAQVLFENLHMNPALGVNIDGISAADSGGYTGVVEGRFAHPDGDGFGWRIQAAQPNDASLRGAGPQWGGVGMMWVEPGKAYSAGVEAYIVSSASGATGIRIDFLWIDSNGGVIVQTTGSVTNDDTPLNTRRWITVDGVEAPDGAVRAIVYTRQITNVALDVVESWWSNFTFVEGPTAPPGPVTGEVDAGYWEGTPHASKGVLYDRSVRDNYENQFETPVLGRALASGAIKQGSGGNPWIYPREFGDVQVTVKAVFREGTSPNYLWSPAIAKAPGGRVIWATNESSNIRFYLFDPTTGANSVMAGTSTVSIGAVPTVDKPYWLRVRRVGDVYTAEWWDVEPSASGSPVVTLTATLTSATSPKREEFAQPAKVGPRFWTMLTGNKGDIQEFWVEPYPYEETASGRPLGVMLNDRIEKTAPFVRVRRVGGLKSLGEPEDVRESATGKRGEVPRPSRRRGKTATYEGDIIAQNLKGLRIAEDLFQSVFDDIEGEGRVDVAATPWSPARFFRARALSCPITENDRKNYSSDFVLTLRLSDPRVFDPELLGPFTTGGITGGSGLTLPVSVPFTMPAGTNASSTVLVTNPGSCDTDPLLTLVGPGRHPQVKNLTLGLTLQFVDLDLGGGDVTVDFRTRRATLENGDDISSQIEASTSDWWDEDAPGLAVGDNLLQFTADGLASPAKMEVRFHAADPA